jgi:hypothetical protein
VSWIDDEIANNGDQWGHISQAGVLPQREYDVLSWELRNDSTDYNVDIFAPYLKIIPE